jgi:hypothetical protein
VRGGARPFLPNWCQICTRSLPHGYYGIDKAMHLEVLLPGIVSFAKQQLPVGGISVTDGEFQPHWFKRASLPFILITL